MGCNCKEKKVENQSGKVTNLGFQVDVTVDDEQSQSNIVAQEANKGQVDLVANDDVIFETKN